MEKAQEKAKEKAKEKPKKSQRKTVGNIEKDILKIVMQNPCITVKELSKKLDRTENSVRYYLRKMTDSGLVERKGSTKSGRWLILK